MIYSMNGVAAGVKDGKVYVRAGEAIEPELARWLAKRLLEAADRVEEQSYGDISDKTAEWAQRTRSEYESLRK